MTKDIELEPREESWGRDQAGSGAFASPDAAQPRGQGARLLPDAGRPGAGRSALLDTLRILRRRIGLILLCLIAVPAAALALSLAQDERYTASASLLFREAGLEQSIFGEEFAPRSRDTNRVAATNQELVSLETIAARTARRVGGGLTAAQVSDSIEIATTGESDLITIEATSTDPALAAQIANTVARETIAFRRQSDRSKLLEAQRLLEQRIDALGAGAAASPRGQALSNRAEQLETVAALQTGNAEIAQVARPPASPSSPNPARNTVLGVLLGLLLGVGLAFVAEQVDRRLKEPEDVEEAFGLPMLGTIPESRALARLGQDGGSRTAEEEAFRRLRTNLRYFNVDRQIRSVLLTSAAPGEGKTTTAWNLATAAARTGEQVLFVEADLRRPALTKLLDTEADRGLSSVLAGVAHFDDVLFSIPLTETADVEDELAPLIDVLAAGPAPPNPAELIESERMRKLLRQVHELYDLVVVDTPPSSLVADAIPLMNQVDGVIIVSQLGRSKRDEAEALREQLAYLNAPVLGVVLNGHSKQTEYYGY